MITSPMADSTTRQTRAATAPTRPRKTMTQDALSSMRELIVMGAIPPGAPLRLEELARTLDMSISPIREAIRQLEVVGLAEHVPYKGARVTYLSLDELRIVNDARVALESLAVRNMVPRFDADLDEQLVSALAALDASYAAGDRSGVVHGNTSFHLAIARGSGSPWLARLVGQTLEVWERYSAALILVDRAEDTFAVEAEGHREILEAFRAGNAGAAEDALRRHLDVSRAIFERGARSTLSLGSRIDG
jgi:DNA-binding GntR family transcriptional regulator